MSKASETEINQWLQAFHDVLQAESNKKIDKAIRLFIRCDDVYKRIIFHSYGRVKNAKELRDKFDTLDLMDGLDQLIWDMEYELGIQSESGKEERGDE